MTTSRHAQPADAQHTPGFQQFAASYTPRLLDPQRWATIRPIVLELAGRLPPTSDAVLRSRIWMITRYVDWAHHDRGIPLHRDRLLDPDVVDHWLHTNGAAEATNRSARWVLRQVGLHATRAAWTPNTRLGRSPVPAPYTPAEIDNLWRVVDRQQTDRLHRIAAAIVTLGLAAGADGRMLPYITADDFTFDRDHATVRLPRPDRQVPIHPRWTPRVRRIVHGLQPGDLVACSQMLLNSELTNINRSGRHTRVAIRCARLRSTYIVELLERQLPLQVILHATGITTAARLAEHLPYTTPLSDSVIADLLTGTDTA